MTIKRLRKGVYSKEPANRWQEALVTGNGELGALVYGHPEEETIILNHERLYEPFHEQVVQNHNLAPYLLEIRQLMNKGRFRDAAALFSEKSGHPLLFTDAYHPAYALKWHQFGVGKVSQYKRTANFETGEITVSWSQEDEQFERNLFISRVDECAYYQIRSTDQRGLSGELFIDSLMPKESGEASCLVNGPFIEFEGQYHITKKGYIGCTHVQVFGQKSVIDVCENKMRIESASEIICKTKLIPISDMQLDGNLRMAHLRKQLLNATSLDYDTSLQKHSHIHSELFNRMSISLGEQEEVLKPTEELLAERAEQLSIPLLQQMFEMGRYVLICSSGFFPPNLVGIWTGEWRPAWSGDFTTDANINLAISGAGMGYLPEGIEAYLHLIEKIVPDWRVNAKVMFGCRGVLAGSRTDGNHNIHTHFDVDWPLGFWTAGAGWLVSPLFEWYQISGDIAFFKEKVLPLLKEIALFYEDFLTDVEDDGKAAFIPSYSPENTPVLTVDKRGEGWQESQASMNATMDIAVAKEVLSHLVSTCQQLQIEHDQIGKWQGLLDKLPEYMINEEGALKEWAHKDLHDQYDHRHLSHLYPVWPGYEIAEDKDYHLFQAAKIALEKRKRGNFSAHGVMHHGIVAARLKNSQLVRENLKLLLQDGDYIHSSLVTSHNPKRHIYNVDANCSLPTLVMEMLVYSVPGKIELLPALPDEIKIGEIKGLKTRSQVTIERFNWDLHQQKIEIDMYSSIAQQVEVRLREEIKSYESNMHQHIERVSSLSCKIDFHAEQNFKITLYF
ncbi:glycosyl hydrolase family 95 catalytic domain-containing protein [Alkalihalobacillus pseudalcaliphilus]|uniref:glycosyl hydrolase family 95 catalytic domain-containing protein n=1 Tax=Alkalihalobacillus pseudalcaliphilus TaxID=79884 RepID=UPI00069D9488|nr:glycoside hydrolase N-terminal domain-containing protein [Alkalihalobacillus pseudalcaliphilus]